MQTSGPLKNRLARGKLEPNRESAARKIMKYGTKPSSQSGSSNDPGNQGDHDIFLYYTNNQDGRYICRHCGNHHAQRRDLVKHNNCREPDNKGNAALRAMANELPLHRRHIRSDAKFASGMTLEAAGQRLPGFNRAEIPVATRRTGPRGQP
eukprot:9523158-Heterocapsa_arctica.AAC.1